MHKAQDMPKPWDLKERTMLFALNILRLCRGLPRTDEAAEIASQLRRAGGSTGAQYRAATRNKSESDYINKIAGAIEECDESAFWLELLARADIAQRNDIQPLQEEANELLAIFTASKATAIERRLRKRQRKAPAAGKPIRETLHRRPDDPY